MDTVALKPEAFLPNPGLDGAELETVFQHWVKKAPFDCTPEQSMKHLTPHSKSTAIQLKVSHITITNANSRWKCSPWAKFIVQNVQ